MVRLFVLMVLMATSLVMAPLPTWSGGQGPSNVNVVNQPNVNVANTSANPVPVKSAPPEIIRWEFSGTVIDGQAEQYSPGVENVPSNNLLVIETIGAFLRFPAGQQPHCRIWVGNGIQGDGISYYVPITNSFTAGLKEEYRGTSPVRIYALPGETILVQCLRYDTSGEGSFTVKIVGHMEKVP